MLCCLLITTAFSQNANTAGAAKYDLIPQLSVLEVNESTTIDVKRNDGENIINFPNAAQVSAGAGAPMYKLGAYKILQGGGKLVFNNTSTLSFTYTGPKQIPKNVDSSAVTISVELVPNDAGVNGTAGIPKIILFTTIYIVSNESAFVVNLPEGGFNYAKYISNNAGGTTVLPIDPRIPPAEAAKLQQQMQKMKSYQVAPQIESNVNLSAITSNASLFYDEKTGLSTIKFTQLSMQMNKAGVGTGYVVNMHPDPSAVMTINFKGKPEKGTHQIVYLPEGVTFATFTGRACECGHEKKQASDEHDIDAPCEGQVVIDEITTDAVKGTIMSRIYYAASGNKITGYITGKFSVLKANQH
jgi:hypothetical protein